MISNNLKYPKLNKLLFEEITGKNNSEIKTSKSSPKVPKTPINNQIPTSPYSSRLKTPILIKTPTNKIATSPYHKEKCLQSPKTPRSPFMVKSPYMIETPYSPYTIETPYSPYSKEKDPWVYNPTMNERFTKVIGIDDYGNTCKLPTVDYQLPQSVRNITEENDGSDDYILIGDIFLDQKNSKGRDYNFVAQNMRNITLQTNNLRSLYANKFRSFDKNIKGKVTLELYEESLEIYENNQVYYQDCIQNETLTYDQLCIYLTELEYWFICIVEPYDYDNYDPDEHSEWKSREQFKINKGYSGYCDPELYFYIKQPLTQEIIRYINYSHKNLFRC
jgi:hypothetical protein